MDSFVTEYTRFVWRLSRADPGRTKPDEVDNFGGDTLRGSEAASTIVSAGADCGEATDGNPF
jgi:hypothetical protein